MAIAAAKKKYVAYYRVSTDRQGRSGLGLEAQQAAVAAFIKEGGRELIADFKEIESGKNNARPVLAKAMDSVRFTGATLLIAKLDRLSRDAAFLLNLKKAEVDFIALDYPDANRMTITIIAAVAEHEGKMISERTKAAMDAAKARGVKFGGWRGGPVVDHTLGIATFIKKADDHALKYGPLAEKLQRGGYSYSQIALELTKRHAKTPRGGLWYASSVFTLLKRYRTLTTLTASVPEPKSVART